MEKWRDRDEYTRLRYIAQLSLHLKIKATLFWNDDDLFLDVGQKMTVYIFSLMCQS